MQGVFRQELGREGEDLAASYLKSAGYRVVERNYRCRQGEVDLIVEKKGVLFFTEVKTRRRVDGVSPRELVTYPKQRRISRAAQDFLAKKRRQDTAATFAVLIIDLSGERPAFEWIEDAFMLAWGY